MTRNEALVKKLDKFFTGIKCNNGHLSNRYVNDGKCISCVSLRAKKYWKIKKIDKNISNQISDPEIREINEKIKEFKLFNKGTSKLKIILKKKRLERNKIVHKDFMRTYQNPLSTILKRREREKKVRKDPVKGLERRTWVNNYLNEKKKKDPVFKIIRNFRARIPKILKRSNISKKNSMLKLLGCSAEEFKMYLENQFKIGMNWSNYGSDWHVDHIVPYDTATSIEDVEKLTHYTNLQPLWAIENLKKSNKF